MNIKIPKKKLRIKLDLDLKILTLSASLTSFGSLFHSWAHLYVKEFLIKIKIKFGNAIDTIFS